MKKKLICLILSVLCTAISSLGKTLFLTCEEAEAKLKELEDGN